MMVYNTPVTQSLQLQEYKTNKITYVHTLYFFS